MRRIQRWRGWLPLTCFIVALTAEICGLRYVWTVDTQTYPRLRNVYVQTGHELHLEHAIASGTQTIIHYSGRAPHDHLITLEMESASLSQNTGLQLASVNAFHTPGKLLYAPEPGNYTGKACTTYFYVEYVDAADSAGHSLTFYPPTTDDPAQAVRARMLHVRSKSPLLVRIGTDLEGGGEPGPNCRNLATIGDWKQSFGPNWEAGFVAAPDSPITITLSSADPNGFHDGANEIESFLEMEALQPTRLFVSPEGVNRPEQVRTQAGGTPMKLSKLQLGSDFLQLELSGLVGVSISDLLGVWKIPLIAALNLPLLVWVGMRSRIKPATKQTGQLAPERISVQERAENRIFLSYSRIDRERVMQIHDRLKAAGADPWIDEQDIAGGVEWEMSIKDQMRHSAYVVIFLSRGSTERAGYVWAEMRMAVQIADEQPEGRSFVIPVRLEECTIPAILSRWNCVDLYKTGGEKKLLDALGLIAPDNVLDRERAVR